MCHYVGFWQIGSQIILLLKFNITLVKKCQNFCYWIQAPTSSYFILHFRFHFLHSQTNIYLFPYFLSTQLALYIGLRQWISILFVDTFGRYIIPKPYIVLYMFINFFGKPYWSQIYQYTLSTLCTLDVSYNTLSNQPCLVTIYFGR